MDIDMPGKDGYETANEIKKLYNEYNIDQLKIVACSGYSNADEEKNCINSGMDYYLSKPVDKVYLKRILKKILL